MIDVGLTSVFARISQRTNCPELLADLFATACVRLLPINGVAIAVFIDGVKVPIGSSDRASAVAEAIEFTVGEGPSWGAHQARQPVVADEVELSRRWPLFYAELAAVPECRSIVVMPFTIEALDCSGALTVYLRNDERLAALDLCQVRAVADEVAYRLAPEAPGCDGSGDLRIAPPWLTGPSAMQRTLTFSAVGVLGATLQINAADALALIRAYAFSTGRSLDDVVRDLTDRRLDPAALRPAPVGSQPGSVAERRWGSPDPGRVAGSA